MKIDNIDLLKQWLVSVLNPIFDGDPEKLALYIVALAKKVEDDQASRERCINDLEVFLETNTNKFVDSLFETLISKKYLTSQSGTSSSIPTPATGDSEQVNTSTVDTTPNNTSNIIRLNTNSGYNDNSRRHGDNNRYDQRDQRSRRFNNNSYDDQNRRSDNSHQNRGNNFNKNRLTRDYDESSSRSNRPSGRERHKNRSRNRNHRGADSTSSSSSSSPETSSTRRYRRSRSYSRSRSNSPRTGSSNDPNVNKKKRCRDFDEKGFCTMAEYCPYDHGEVVIAPALNTPKQSQQPTSSAPKSNEQQSQIPTNQNFSIPGSNMPSLQGSYPPNSGDMFYQRQNHHAARVGIQHPGMGRVNMNNNMNNNRPGMLPNQGMQGQPRFPMNDPNIQDYNHQQDFQQRQMMGGNRPRNLVNIVTSVNDNQGDNAYQGNQQRSMKRPYNNLNTPVNDSNFSYNNQQQLNMQKPPDYNPNGQQQTALLPNPPGMPNHLQQSLPQQQFNHKPSNFNQNQSNQGNQGPNTSTTLVLRKVPIDMNRPEIIRQHFIKFGQIMDIQCKYDNLNDATLIRFANNQQAFAAFKSPESILNNRFIRIHWLHYHQKVQNQHSQNQHSQQQNQGNTIQNNETPSNDEPSLKRRFGNDQNLGTSQHDLLRNKENKHFKAHHHPNVGNVTSTGDSITKTIQNTNQDANTGSDSTSETSKNNNELEKSENQTGSGQVLSNNFNSMSLKQTQQADKTAATKAINDENQKKVLLLKMQVKQKARELIEQQIKDQKLLLKKFEQAKSVEEKSQILSLVKKLSESIEKEKDILNNKNYSFDEQASGENPSNFNPSPFSFQKSSSNIAQPTAPKSIPAPPHSLKLNNLRYNQTNFLKNQALNMQMKTSQTKALSNQKESPASNPKLNPAQFKESVDNRPKRLIITGVENIQEKEAIINFVNAIGCQVETSTDAEKNETSNLFSFIVSFYSRKDAEMALAKCSSSLTSKTISITWYLAPVKNTSDNSESLQEVKQSDTVSDQENSKEIEDLNNDTQNTELPVENKDVKSETQTETSEKDLVDDFFDTSATGEEILS